jgi:serine/threonine protein kinase
VISGQIFENNGFEMSQVASTYREIPHDQVMIGKELGSGQFGLVVRGYLKDDKTHCAIKMLKGI